MVSTLTALPQTRSQSSPVTRIAVETITDRERFETMRADWTALLADSGADHLFLSWEWLYTWWTHLAGGRRLFVLAVWRGGRLIALAPLAVTPGRRVSLCPLASLAFLGTGSVGSDYLDVIVAPGREADAYDALAARLGGQTLSLALAQVPREASAAAQLAARLARRGWRWVERPADVCPFIPLAGATWASYLGGLTGHHRSNFRRRLANLERSFELRFERALSDAQRADALAAFLDLHDRRWRGRGGSTGFHSDALREFHEAWTRLALARGWLRLFVLRLDDRAVGAIYGFRYGGTFGFYQIGFDPELARRGV